MPWEEQTSKTALLRNLLESLQSRDVVVADRFYCSFMMIALLLGRGVDVCARLHQRRHADFRPGKRLGKYDHLVEWTRSAKPSWMDEATYTLIPEKITLREIRFNVFEPGYRVQTLTVVTTLTDPKAFTAEDIAQLYGFRWNSEEYHKAMKTGCRIEDLQFTAVERLQPAIALLSAVSLTLLNLRDATRHPDAKKRRATTLFATEYVEVLSFWRYRTLRSDLTIHDFFYALARLGGHQNRRSDHRPGWLILWRGWAKLQNMLDGYLLAQRKNVGEPKVKTHQHLQIRNTNIETRNKSQ